MEKHHSLYTCNIEQSNMSSNTNQTPATPTQQLMAALQASLGPTTSASRREVNKSFIGRKSPDKQSKEVTVVDKGDDNPPEKDKEDLGQCSSFKKKGQKDSRCKQKVLAVGVYWVRIRISTTVYYICYSYYILCIWIYEFNFGF